jgi:hypothetical protein
MDLVVLSREKHLFVLNLYIFMCLGINFEVVLLYFDSVVS